jgi:hypothetical protein
MGQPIVVTEKPTTRPDVVRFQTNRILSGMGHERYRSLDDIVSNRWVDEAARKLFESGKVEAVHIFSNEITVDLKDGQDAHGLADVIEDLYTHYRPGVLPSIP